MLIFLTFFANPLFMRVCGLLKTQILLFFGFDTKVDSLTSTVDSLNATINAQTQLIAQLNQTIQELKEQLNKEAIRNAISGHPDFIFE